METINGQLFRNMILNSSVVLENHKQAINELNVFPVPDGDTGTNMSLTMNSAAKALRELKNADEIGAVSAAAAAALLRGARGNSGVILSLLFRGMSQAFKGKSEVNAAEFSLAMSDGVSSAYKAVGKPTEGTILTVSRLAAAAACDYCVDKDEPVTFEELLEVCLKEAKIALADTVNQNPVLKKAGVIDSGGKGYVYILEAIYAAIRGETFTMAEPSDTHVHTGGFFAAQAEEITFGYEALFYLTRENRKDPQLLQAFLGSIGDSVVMVVDDEVIKVHVHTDDPGKVLTEALTYGAIHDIKVENFRDQNDELSSPGSTAALEPEFAEIEKEIGIVAVCAGDGLAEVFQNLGADRIVSGGQTMNPSTEDILKEINRVPAKNVFVLPNNSNIILAASQCVGSAKDRTVIVVPTKSVPQGVAALLTLDPDADALEIESAMNEAFSNVHTISVTNAARDSVFDDTQISEGDALALLEGKLLAATKGIEELKNIIIEQLIEFAPEFITLYLGETADITAAETFIAAISDAIPDAEITSVTGGQPVYEYIISAE